MWTLYRIIQPLAWSSPRDLLLCWLSVEFKPTRVFISLRQAQKCWNSAKDCGTKDLLVRFTQGMDGLLGVAGTIIFIYCGSFPPYVNRTNKKMLKPAALASVRFMGSMIHMTFTITINDELCRTPVPRWTRSTGHRLPFWLIWFDLEWLAFLN